MRQLSWKLKLGRRVHISQVGTIQSHGFLKAQNLSFPTVVREGDVTLEILRDAALLGLNIKGQEHKIRNVGDLQ